jgi:cytochrome c-type biogenesis protein CcmE
MKIKKSHIIGGILVAAAVGLSINSFRSTLTPYVSVAEAKAHGHSVQVAGMAVKGSDRYDLQTNNLVFTLREDGGAQMTVEYDGARPGNFDDVTKIVAIGHYEKKEAVFYAKELLIKCPTKYEGRVKGE